MQYHPFFVITIDQGECCIGQPFSGYALRSIPGVESTIVGVLIRKEAFFRSFLQTFSYMNWKKEDTVVNRILAYMDDHFQSVTLRELAEHFSYHPNYISGLLHRETGKTFSEILLEKRMEHALVLMKGTDLSNEEIADFLGYSSTTNYYKAFRKFYGMSPREYAGAHRLKAEGEYPLARSHYRN